MKEKGTTLTVLVITIAVLSMIAGTATMKITTILETDKYTKFKNDLTSLNESISQIYGSADSIAQVGPIYSGDTGSSSFLYKQQGDGRTVKNPNDGSVYYVINADKLNTDLQNKFNIHLTTLNYGSNNYGISSTSTSSSLTNVYIINGKTRTIYYTAGVEYKGSKYYRISEDYSSLPNKTLFVDEQNISKWNKLYESRFTFTYNDTTEETKVSVTGGGGWEILYLPISVTSGKKYDISLEYTNNSGSTALSSSYSGAGFQVLKAVADGDNSSNSVNTVYLSNTKSSTYTKITNEFTASQSTMYIALNFGMLADGSTYSFTFKNILIQEQ